MGDSYQQAALDMQEVLLRFIGGADPRCSAGARELAQNAVAVAHELAAAAVVTLLAELTARPESITLGAQHDAALAAEIAADFCRRHLRNAPPNFPAFNRTGSVTC